MAVSARNTPSDSSVMSALRSATALSHRNLEKRLNIAALFDERASYRAYLEKVWGFCRPLESLLSLDCFDHALPDYETRRKLPLLTRDLWALGLSAGAVDALPCCATIPQPISAAFAFGCTYVLEGATLGGRTLLPVAETRLGVTRAGGASYLSSYGEQVGAMWHAFGSAVEAWACDQERRQGVTRAAVQTFDLLTAWLCGHSHD